MNITQLTDSVIESVKGYIARNLGPLVARVDVLEKRAPVAGPRGEKGDAGAPGVGEIGPMGPKGDKGDTGERGEKGEAGRDGKDGAPGPAGQKGLDGAAGRDGINGKDGAPGLQGEKGAQGERGDPGMRGDIGPQGEKGADGINGRDGAAGLNGKDGADGRDGKDAAPVDVEKIALDVLSRVHPPRDGRDGAPGKPGEKGDKGQDGAPGRDGLSLEHFDAEILDDGRTLVLSLQSGDVKVSKSVKMRGIQIYRGVWKAGRYEHGDVVTYGGSQWHARADNSETPGSDSKAWQLCVKRGRDGKDTGND